MFDKPAQGIKAMVECQKIEFVKEFMLDPMYGYIQSSRTIRHQDSEHMDLPSFTKEELKDLES